METYDTIIVGAGLAGLQCARALSRHGISVLLIDRKPSLSQTIHTTGIFVRKTLEDFDVPYHCLGPSVRHVSLYSPALRVLNVSSKRDEFRIGRMAALYQYYLNQCVQNGVKWQPGVSYLGHSVDGAMLGVHLDYKSRVRRFRTRYIIGADGARSHVAADLALEQNREFLVGVEQVFTNVVIDGGPCLHCFFDPELAPGYIGWIAYDGEEAHVGVAGYAYRFDPLASLNKFRSKITPIIDLSNTELSEQRAGRIPVGGVLRRIANERGMLIGDAAGAVSPLTAGGLDGCMRLSNFAASVVAQYLNTGNADVLNSYSGGRFRARFASRLWARRLISYLHGPKTLELGFMALSLPLCESIVRHVFFSRRSFPDVKLSLGKPLTMEHSTDLG